jgi:hypothetical protein
VTQMTARARVKDHPWFHLSSLGPWYMKFWKTHSIGGIESRPDPGTVEE